MTWTLSVREELAERIADNFYDYLDRVYDGSIGGDD